MARIKTEISHTYRVKTDPGHCPGSRGIHLLSPPLVEQLVAFGYKSTVFNKPDYPIDADVTSDNPSGNGTYRYYRFVIDNPKCTDKRFPGWSMLMFYQKADGKHSMRLTAPPAIHQVLQTNFGLKPNKKAPPKIHDVIHRDKFGVELAVNTPVVFAWNKELKVGTVNRISPKKITIKMPSQTFLVDPKTCCVINEDTYTLYILKN
jgi:hypothetical protein